MKKADLEEKEQEEQEEVAEAKEPEEIKDLLRVDQMELEIGYSLIPLVDSSQGGDLLERITMIRKQVALEFGMVVPPIRIRDNMQLNPNEYSLKIKGSQVAGGELMVGYYLAMDPGGVAEEINGIPTMEPAFGLPAQWISEDEREKSEILGYTVVDPTSVLATHLTELVKKHAHEILGRESVKELLDNIKEDYSVVVEEVYPKQLDLGEIQTVLQNLLIEGISIRQLPVILETLADAAKLTRNIEALSEYARGGLARQICNNLKSNDGKLKVITLNPSFEEMIKEHLQETDMGNYLTLPPELNEKLFAGIKEESEKSTSYGYQPILLLSPELRKPVRRLIERGLKAVSVLSYNEIIPEIELEAIGMVSFE